MICPNCGRELPEHARVCPGCTAVQHVSRRRRRDSDLPAHEENPRIEYRAAPDDAEIERRRQLRREQAARADASAQPNGRPKNAGEARLPVGLHKQEMRRKSDARRVRHMPRRKKRKLDANPALTHTPIYRKSHKKLLIVIIFTLLLLLFMGAASGYMLVGSESGQRMMAQWGWSMARTDAYITLGRELYEGADYTQALEKLGVAIEREPKNVDALNLMAQCHMARGETDKAVEIYEALIGSIAPEHPSAYRNLIRIYQDRGYNAEALTLMREAAEKTTNMQEFNVMLRESTPVTPTLSHPEGRYNSAIDVTISIPPGETVYYTTDGTDPSESGLIYVAGTKIHIPEGKMTVKTIGFAENGTPSEQVTANYTVIIPTPAAPKANMQSGKYKKAPKVSLRPGSEDKKENDRIVAIYYTLDGRQATQESTLYTEPIQIPIGDSVLRAIAVADNGKISYEMKVTYKVEGNLKRMFNSADTFKNMELFKTSYNTFSKNWGAPDSYELLPEEQWYEPGVKCYEAVYPWGTARFIAKSSASNPVLYALDTTSEKMTGPRSTKIGMNDAKVMEKFRDLGHPALDDDGNRLLYNYDSAGKQFGTFRREEDGSYAIHYFYPADAKETAFVELSYFLDSGGNVRRILWQRYMSEL